jgi:hypothetical protein
MVLNASPYAANLANAVSAEIDHVQPELAVRLIELLRVTGTAIQRPLIERLALHPHAPTDIRIASLATAAHLTGPGNTSFWPKALRVLGAAGDDVKRRVVYGLGMQADTDTLLRVTSDTDLSPRLRMAARWWIDLPSSIVRSARH